MPELRYEAQVYPRRQSHDYYTLALGIRRANSTEPYMEIYSMSDSELRQLVQAVNKFAVERGNAATS